MNKNILVELKKILGENRKYSTKDLYICKFKFNCDSNEQISKRYICKVKNPVFGDSAVFENIITGEIYKIKKENDENIEILEMIYFSDAFPDVFYPSLATILCLMDELEKNNGFIKTLR